MAERRPRGSTGAWYKPRTVLLLALAIGFLGALASALAVGLVVGGAEGRDLIAGALIGLVPQLWFLRRASGPRAGQNAAAAALARYSLTATGFALWFYSVPEASALWTLAGTLESVLVVSLAIFGLSRR